jgi:electron transport complex protein RnfB
VKNSKPSIDAIDAWLPQTQCTQCGYPRCRAYAEAIANGKADINQCPPGDKTTINGLARLSNSVGKPLNPAFGRHKPRQLMVIDEDLCIGCTLCIQACPVDAIVGAAKMMHTIIAEQCTGCELCIPPCPVDCIDTVPAPKLAPEPHWRWPDYRPEQIEQARQQTEARLRRLQGLDRARSLKKKHLALKRGGARRKIQTEISAAVSRTRSRRQMKSR